MNQWELERGGTSAVTQTRVHREAGSEAVQSVSVNSKYCSIVSSVFRANKMNESRLKNTSLLSTRLFSLSEILKYLNQTVQDDLQQMNFVGFFQSVWFHLYLRYNVICETVSKHCFSRRKLQCYFVSFFDSCIITAVAPTQS